jgi:hypothetical protein
VEEWRMKTFLVLRMEREGKTMRGKIDRRSWQRKKRGKRWRKRLIGRRKKKKTLLTNEITDFDLLIEAFH